MPDAVVSALDAPINPARAPNSASTADDIIEVLRRRIWLLLAATLAGLAIATLVAFTTPKTYTASTQLLINVGDRQVVEDVRGLTPPQETGPSIETQTEVLRTRALAARVVDALNLAEDPEFNPLLKDPEAKGRPLTELDRKIAIEVTMGALKVKRVPGTYIIEISYKAKSAEKAALIADTYAEQFLIQQVETKYDAVATTGEYIEQRLAILRDDLLQKERAVEAYRAESGMLTADGSVLAEQSIAQLNVELSNARAALAEREARLRSFRAQIAAGGDGASTPEALASGTIVGLRAQQAELARRRAELSEKYLERHPRLIAIEREAQDLDAQIRLELERIAASMQENVESARLRVRSIEQSLGEQRTTLAQTNVGGVELKELQREAEASRALYQAFLERSRQLSERRGIEEANATIVVRATPPLAPSAPNTKLYMILGLAAGLGLGAALVWVLELMERTVRRAEDIEYSLGVPCLGALPLLTRAERTFDGEIVPPADFILRKAVSPYSEALRSLRAALFFADNERDLKVLALTSAMPQEGKTTTSIGLARMSAISGMRTVLVDCDLRRRSSSAALGVEADNGLIEYLEAGAPVEAVIHKDPLSDLDVIPLVSIEFRPSDLLGSQRMQDLIKLLRERYDVVILDTAPILPIADTRVLCSYADAVMFTVQWGRTPLSRLRDAIELVRHHEGRIVGAAIHGVGTSVMSRLIYDSRDYYVDLYDTYYAR